MRFVKSLLIFCKLEIKLEGKGWLHPFPQLLQQRVIKVNIAVVIHQIDVIVKVVIAIQFVHILDGVPDAGERLLPFIVNPAACHTLVNRHRQVHLQLHLEHPYLFFSFLPLEQLQYTIKHLPRQAFSSILNTINQTFTKLTKP